MNTSIIDLLKNYVKKGVTLNFTCPTDEIKTGEYFKCSVTNYGRGCAPLDYLINYGDGQIQQSSSTDKTVYIKKAYSLAGNYTISVRAINKTIIYSEVVMIVGG